ncbi:hypothetical protein QOT17_021461 [Balamuthia mandrillaris]
MEEGREDERRRTHGKKGIKTKATIRDNTYDRHYASPKPILYFPNEADVPYSINKAKRWELVEQLKQVCHTCEHAQEDELRNGVADEGREKHCEEGIPDIKEVMEVQLRESQDIGEKSFRSLGSNDPSHGYFPGGCWGKEKGGRDFVRVTVTLGACNECHNPNENVFASTTATTNEGEVQDETKEQQKEAKRLLRKERNKAKVEKKDLHRKHHETAEEKEEAHQHEEEDQEEEADCEEDSEDEVEETLEGIQVVKTQERKLAQVKDGRVIVQQPFEKGKFAIWFE